MKHERMYKTTADEPIDVEVYSKTNHDYDMKLKCNRLIWHQDHIRLYYNILNGTDSDNVKLIFFTEDIAKIIATQNHWYGVDDDRRTCNVRIHYKDHAYEEISNICYVSCRPRYLLTVCVLASHESSDNGPYPICEKLQMVAVPISSVAGIDCSNWHLLRFPDRKEDW